MRCSVIPVGNGFGLEKSCSAQLSDLDPNEYGEC